MTDRFDAELKTRFAELRARDAELAPPFRLPDPVVVKPSRRIRLALAAAALLAAGAAIGYLTLHSPTPMPAARDILAWRAPTDFLLRQPGRFLLSASVIDRFIPTTALFHGDQR